MKTRIKQIIQESIDSVVGIDAEYMDAVNRGDMETASRLVREKAKQYMPNTVIKGSDGYPLVCTHGTNENFTKFEALGYGQYGQGAYFCYGEGGRNFGDVVIHAYVDLRKLGNYQDLEKVVGPADQRSDEEVEESGIDRDSVYGTEYDMHDFDWHPEIQTMLMNAGYDGFVDDGNYGFVLYELNDARIKSADPVTYDNDGNVIPLSRRFDRSTNDIRF